ncbi:hypothetical protein PRZ48_002248 [Zasmidium cellare]|uniref:Uncharacterized protein n=1 Tax=Zasmidium cellare TaxID=395010 RepID=A0ABR0F3H8_ZASCE|nr:hypothetical protein PRZ48_002248 [Zasmidium cellare]
MPRPNFEQEDSDAASTENLLKHPEDFIPYPWLKREPSKSWKLIALYATAATLYGLIATGGIFYLWFSRGEDLIYSPASPIVEFETRVFDPHLRGDPDFFGPPSAEVDSNWQEVMSASTIHLSEADRQHFDRNLPMVRLPDGTYVGQLMVYHELHCLKRLYQYMNAEYYFPNLTQHDREMNKMHTGPSFPEGKGTKIGFGDENIDDMGKIINLNSPDR